MHVSWIPQKYAGVRYHTFQVLSSQNSAALNLSLKQQYVVVSCHADAGPTGAEDYKNNAPPLHSSS